MKPAQTGEPIQKGEQTPYSLTGATLVTPTEILDHTDLTLSGRRIAYLDQEPCTPGLDLRDYYVFPGLINAHDHLNGTWWPRVAPGRPYTNVYQWLDDLHTSPVRYDRQRNSVEDIYELGMYRNLISGVTTVADHFLRIDGSEFYTRFPIDVLFDYGRTWTPREPMGWGDDIPTEYKLAVCTGQPYIIHLAEGVDPETAREMDVLLEAEALGRNTLIVHGISLRPEDMRAMARVGASLCWCPSSNLYLYGRTADIPALLDAGVNVTLGTDSSLSGGMNLLDELRTAQRAAAGCFFSAKGSSTASRQLGIGPHGRGPSVADGHQLARWLIESVTTRAAYALLREDCRGRIAPGYDADLLVLPNAGHDPYETLIQAEVGDIALLIRAGKPVYGDGRFRTLFEQFAPQFTPVLVQNSQAEQGDASNAGAESPKEKLVAGDPLGLLDRLFQTVGRTVEFPFLPLTAPT